MPGTEIIASRSFSEELQEAFAVLSGDRNPMHLDPLVARRTQAGRPVAHGVHTLLWALEELVESGRTLPTPCAIKVKFLKWVYRDDECVLSVTNEANPRIVTIRVGDMLVLSAELSYGKPTTENRSPRLSPRTAALPAPLEFTFTELDNRSGDAFTASEEDVRLFFPCLSAAMGPVAVAEVVACSYVVGMAVPGLHSMFSKLDVTIAAPLHTDSVGAALHYVVTSQDERFRKIGITLSGNSLAGAVDAFVRVPPMDQPSIKTVASRVGASEFEGMNALVIGGSRGLGELTAKLIAAGGGAATITHATGKADAERVAAQIIDWGGQVRVMPYDVRVGPEPQLVKLSVPPTHLFYFATSSIFRPKGSVVSAPILADFTIFYLYGFHDLCVQLTKGHSTTLTSNKLIAYYPSSVAVAERPPGMTEYAMAKAAGEQMCRDMTLYLSNLHILTTRLPRLPTDQTAGVLPEVALDPVEVLLPIVREMKRLSDKI